MAQLWIPDRFIARPAEDFIAGLTRVSALYWHLHRTGHAAAESDQWTGACGSLEAMNWIAGLSPFPPAYGKPMDRNRANLMRLATYAQMVIDGLGEELDGLDPYADIIDRHRIGGAGTVYRWALRLGTYLPGDDLLPEDIRAARRHYLATQAAEQTAA